MHLQNIEYIVGFIISIWNMWDKMDYVISSLSLWLRIKPFISGFH